MINLKKILYPTDFSEFSRCAMPYAMEFSRHFDSRLHCLHVVEPSYVDSMVAAETHEPTITDKMGSMQQRMQEFIDEFLKADQDHVVPKAFNIEAGGCWDHAWSIHYVRTCFLDPIQHRRPVDSSSPGDCKLPARFSRPHLFGTGCVHWW